MTNATFVSKFDKSDASLQVKVCELKSLKCYMFTASMLYDKSIFLFYPFNYV